MPNEEIFSGLPGLEDTAGLEEFLNQETLKGLGFENPVTQTQTQAPAQNQDVNQTIPAPQFTSEDIQAIITKNQALENQIQQFNAQRQVSQNQNPNQSQSQNPQANRQTEIIKQLIDRGVPLERIVSAMQNKNSTDPNKNILMQKVSQMEQYLQKQQYEAELNGFVDKMTSFGNKLGLSENDLVVFGEKAFAEGIDIRTVRDVETVFRALYPEQYSIRSQRLSNQNSSQIFGGSSMQEAPRVANSKAIDSYVESFLKQSMPNSYPTRNNT